jgi:hypothetical protein
MHSLYYGWISYVWFWKLMLIERILFCFWKTKAFISRRRVSWFLLSMTASNFVPCDVMYCSMSPILMNSSSVYFWLDVAIRSVMKNIICSRLMRFPTINKTSNPTFSCPLHSPVTVYVASINFNMICKSFKTHSLTSITMRNLGVCSWKLG